MSRNVVLVTYDSLRADHCGFMGYERDTTPTLDRLAARGTVFASAVAGGLPATVSMASAMTGRHPIAGDEAGPAGCEEVTSPPTLAEALSARGYSTGGLSAHPTVSGSRGFDRGFDWFEDVRAGDGGVLGRAWTRVLGRAHRPGDAPGLIRLLRASVRRGKTLRPWEAHYDRLLEWRSRVGEPYFLWVLLADTRQPWLPPAGWRRWSSRGDVYRSVPDYRRLVGDVPESAFTAAQHRRLVDLYDDAIRYGDRFLARLSGDLHEDDPVFVVHADHGEAFGEHGRYGLQPALYEPMTHVPLVVADGREAAADHGAGPSAAGRSGGTGERVTRPVGLRSLAATVTDIASVPDPFPARSAFDAGGTPPWAVSTVVADGSRRVAVRTARYKYIESPGRRELYNLVADPGESRDLVRFTPDLADQLARVADAETDAARERQALDDALEECTRTLAL